MNFGNIFIPFIVINLIVLNVTETANNRAFEMILYNWQADEKSDVYTCIQVIASGASNIVLDSIRSDSTKEVNLIYDPPRLTVKEFDYTQYGTIELQVMQCDSSGISLPGTYTQDFFRLNTILLYEFPCNECISRYNMGKMASYIKIVSTLYNEKARGILFQNLRTKYISRKTEDGVCCTGDTDILHIDKCNGCNYNFAMNFGATEVAASKNYYSEDNIERVFPNILISGNMNNVIFTDPKIYLMIKQNNLKKIDEYRDITNLIFHPYQQFYYSSLLGDYSNVEITGSITLTSEGYAGPFGQYSFTWIDENFTTDDNGKIVCVNKIYDDPRTCKRDISRCGSSPCLNGGKCLSILGNYQCQCLDNGWFGYNCEKFTCKPACKNSRCIGLNKCGPCLEGWTGQNCETRVCLQNNICGDRKCSIKNGRQTCECNPKLEAGDKCQVKCFGGCVNGICVILSANPYCLCSGNYTGIKCDSTRAINYRTIPASKTFIIFITAIPAGIIFILLNISIIYSKCYNVKSTKRLINDPVVLNEINNRKIMLLTNTLNAGQDIESKKKRFDDEKSTYKSSQINKSNHRSRSRRGSRDRKTDRTRKHHRKHSSSSSKSNSDSEYHNNYYKVNSRSGVRRSNSNNSNYSDKYNNGESCNYKSGKTNDNKRGNDRDYKSGNYSERLKDKSKRISNIENSKEVKNKADPVNFDIEIYEKDDQIKFKFLNDKENNSKNKNDAKNLKEISSESNDNKASKEKKNYAYKDDLYNNPYA